MSAIRILAAVAVLWAGAAHAECTDDMRRNCQIIGKVCADGMEGPHCVDPDESSTQTKHAIETLRQAAARRTQVTQDSATMVCCRTNFSDTTCTSANTTWTSKANCDAVGAAGTDGKTTCSDSTCGH